MRALRLDAAPLGHDIDPLRDSQPGVDELAWLYADGLFGWDRGLSPLLAADLPDVIDGGLRYRYRLRRATWHDGRPVVASDVAAALAAVRATPWGTREPYRSVRELLTRGDHGFDVVLDSPRRGFVRSFFGPVGFPAIPLVRRDAGGMPVGTGPFAVRARPELGRWRLERWERSPRGVPRADAIELRLIASELTANVQLLSGEADIALPLTSGAMRSDRYAQVRRYTSTAALVFNAEAALRSAELRRAFARAIDVRALQRAYDRHRTTLRASLVLGSPNDASFAAALAGEAAPAALLRDLLNGTELTIAYVGESAVHQRVATLLQQMLRSAGVAAVLRPASASVYAGSAGPLRTGRFDVAISGFTYGEDPDLAADWSCANRPPAGGNFSRWCDARFEAAILRNDVDGARRRLYDSMACIPLSEAYEVIGVSSRVRGFSAPPLLVPATLGCARWRIA